MKKKIYTFSELSDDARSLAGGKGGTLSKLFQAGYPVPDGFVVMPTAFEGDQLNPVAWHQVQNQLENMRKGNGKASFAVRSSATAEDSAYASFAGEFETVLDVHSDTAILAAILQVRNSRRSERVQAYSQAKGMQDTQEIAIVVQKLVRADISGILFTADPVSGNRSIMTGNYIYGFGEELVSGEAEPYTFTLQVPKGDYDGPVEMQRYSRRLYKFARKLVQDLGCPQDIEWAIADGKLYILQSRPITTLLGYDPVKGEWNSSLTGDFAWASSEVYPDTLTPASWSIWKNLSEILAINPVGNICGRFYLQMSLEETIFKMLGKDHAYVVDYVKLTTGFDMDKIVVPDVPETRMQLFRQVFPLMIGSLPKQIRLMKNLEEIIENNPQWCENTRREIMQTQDRRKLTEMWSDVLWPAFWNLLQMQNRSNKNYFLPYMSARSELIKIIGQQEAETLLANLVGESGDLASMGQLLGLQKLAEGQISKEEYHLIAGHRPPSENEISVPRLYENPEWIDQRLKEYANNSINYIELQDKKRQKYLQIWGEFANRFPKKSVKIKARLDKTIQAMETREKIRTELTRCFGVFRTWFLRAGEITGMDEDIFYLESEEVQQLLQGVDHDWSETITARREAYQRHLELPPLPMMISGRFDPYTWSKDPMRRSDFYDSHMPKSTQVQDDVIKGYPGSAGQVEGLVRIIKSPAESEILQNGEILVAASTDVGWTHLFPKAAAVITDIGAPLSHAAIVARELGIPAVVGTGNSTSFLKTGDRVRVDGSIGTVELLEKAALK